MIKFNQVAKRFGEITALHDVDFEIGTQEFVFITGPSGAGKTTLLKLLLRDYHPSSGEIIIDEENISTLSKKKLIDLRRKIGVVFQDLRLLCDRTVYENVALPLKVIGKKNEEVRNEVDEVLELVGLSDRSELFPAQLAGGELQRVGIARAVIAKPKIIVADEPTGNLDPTTSWQIANLLKKINTLGKTVIMATHNVDIVNSMAERVIVLDKGKLVADKKKGKYTSK